MTLFLLLACAERPGGPPTINGDPDHDWPALPAFDQSIVDIIGRDSVPGLSACMVVGGEVTWCNGYGARNTDNGDLAYATRPFLLASVSKAVTALAIIRAVEDGHLGLDAPIGDTLDFDVVHPDEPGTPITLRHLMGHTSGIADNWDVMEAHIVEGDSTEPLGEFLNGYLSVGGADYSESDNFLRRRPRRGPGPPLVLVAPRRRRRLGPQRRRGRHLHRDRPARGGRRGRGRAHERPRRRRHARRRGEGGHGGRRRPLRGRGGAMRRDQLRVAGASPRTAALQREGAAQRCRAAWGDRIRPVSASWRHVPEVRMRHSALSLSRLDSGDAVVDFDWEGTDMGVTFVGTATLTRL